MENVKSQIILKLSLSINIVNQSDNSHFELGQNHVHLVNIPSFTKHG